MTVWLDSGSKALMSVNKVILVGRLGQDPESRATPSGASVCNFSLATNEAWTDKSGQRQERTEWHRIVVWGKQAELCQQYLSKGRQAYIEGKLQTRSWEDQSGQKRYTTEVQAQTIRFLGGKEMGASSGASSYGGASDSFEAPMGASQGGGASFDEPSFTEDDIPF